MAGTEHSGPESGFAALFNNRWCILTPTEDNSIKAVERVSALWEGLGARIEIMEPHRRDLVLGITSHLPHLIAYTIVDTANKLEDDLKSEVIKYSASGFHGFTRIAATNRIQLRRGGQTVVFNYRALEQGAALARETSLADGDVIVVPQRKLFEF